MRYTNSRFVPAGTNLTPMFMFYLLTSFINETSSYVTFRNGVAANRGLPTGEAEPAVDGFDFVTFRLIRRYVDRLTAAGHATLQHTYSM